MGGIEKAFISKELDPVETSVIITAPSTPPERRVTSDKPTEGSGSVSSPVTGGAGSAHLPRLL